MEEKKNYHISFVGYDPERKRMPGQVGLPRVYFTCDTLRFATRAQQMEFFDNPEKVFEHLRKTDLLKMILTRNMAGRMVAPLVEMSCYLQGDGRERFYFDECREVEIAVDGSKDNKIHNVTKDTTHQKLYIDKDKHGEWDAQPVKLQ
jgi:hypothetical protein